MAGSAIRMGLLTRRPDISPEAFIRHWREVHGPLAAELPGLRRYHQNHLRGRLHVAGAEAGDWPLDGISQLQFVDGADMRALSAAPAYRAVAADEPRSMLPSRVIVAERQVVLPLAEAGRPRAKAILLLSRPSGLDDGALAKASLAWAPGLAGCAVSVVTDRIMQGAPVGHGAIPLDAVVELWFAASPPGRLTLPPALSGAVATAWHVESHEVL